jgi:LacI family transcriptional regulator
MVTIYDIAKRANVSAMTVSRVIHNTGKISEKTKARVRRVMEELNYVPNQNARSLALHETRTLFLLITDIPNPFFTTVARGAEDAATQNGYRLLFGNSDENLSKESEYIQTILATRVDGVLVAPAGDSSLPHLEKLKRYNVPFVLLDREVPGIESDIVLGNSKEGSRMLVRHLAQHGHRRIAMINGSSSISSARLRLQGFVEALKLNDLPCEPHYVYEASFGPRADLTGIEAWLDGMAELPSAIVAGNNVLEGISLVCFDDFGPHVEFDPFMTVVAQQAYQFGYLGIHLLIERIRKRELAGPWKRIVLPAELIVRRSVADLRGEANGEKRSVTQSASQAAPTTTSEPPSHS